MAVATDITVGDVWRGFQASHNGWEIRIVKVTPQSVGFVLVGGPSRSKQAHRNVRGNWLPKYVIERSFELLRAGERKEKPVAIVERNDVVREHLKPEDVVVWAAVNVDHRVCTSCGEDKPESDFDLAPTRGDGPAHRLFTCHQCMVAKRTAGIRASFARKQALAALETEAVIPDRPTPTIEAEFSRIATRVNEQMIAPPEPRPAPTPAPAPTPRPSLSAALLELAAQAEDLEHSPVYRALAASVDTLLAARTDAGPVAVVPMALVEHLIAQAQAAHAELDSDAD